MLSNFHRRPRYRSSFAQNQDPSFKDILRVLLASSSADKITWGVGSSNLSQWCSKGSHHPSSICIIWTLKSTKLASLSDLQNQKLWGRAQQTLPLQALQEMLFLPEELRTADTHHTSPDSLSVCLCHSLFQLPPLLLFSCSVMSDSLRPHGMQHAGLPCPSLSFRVCSNSSPLSHWCHPTICCPLLLLSSIFPSIRVFSNESALCIRWPRYWSFRFSSNEFSSSLTTKLLLFFASWW